MQAKEIFPMASLTICKTAKLSKNATANNHGIVLGGRWCTQHMQYFMILSESQMSKLVKNAYHENSE